MAYLMESKMEAERLLKKSEYESSKQQLLLTGLEPSMVAVDAGGGSGFVTKIMAEIIGSKGLAILIDQSQNRIDVAKKYNQDLRNLSYVCSPLEKISLQTDLVDYTFCRFVFEYLRDPIEVMDELIRITKPGGKIVVGDLDYNMLSHYPLEAHLESQLLELAHKLEELDLWDPYVGRKLYRLFRVLGLQNIKVHMLPHHLIYGESEERDHENWTAKLDQMKKLHKQGILQLSFDLDAFASQFLEFFKSPERFSYSPLFLVEGQKPVRT